MYSLPRQDNARAEVNPPPYRYTRFTSNESIRLLKLRPGSASDKITCSLIEALFDPHHGCISDSLPPDSQHLDYDALSWSWGSEARTASIDILNDGMRFSFNLSPKLEAALKALRSDLHTRVLWIDAICIDQDHQNEKSHQIPLMDRIYGHARQVCVWLGEANEKTKDAFRFIKEDILKEMNFDTICQRPDASKKLEALSDLMQRHWFSRRWVVQEIALAKKASIYCGSEEMDWKEFAIAVELFVGAETQTRLAGRVMLKETLVAGYFDNVSALSAAVLVSATSNLFRRTTDSKKRPEGLMTLEYLVCRLASFQTSQPHDTIYSFLAIAKDTVPIAPLINTPVAGRPSQLVLAAQRLLARQKLKARQFLVDYSKRYEEVCRDFVRFAIDQTADRRRALDIICRPWAHEFEALPSWVSTLASAPFEMNTKGRGIRLYRRNGNPFVGLPSLTQRAYAAAGDREADDRFIRFKTGGYGNSLFVVGFVLDVIDEIEGKPVGGNVPEEWLQLGGWRQHNEDPPEDLWRTLVGDRGPNGDNPPLYYSRACREALRRSDGMRDIETSAITSRPDEWNSSVADFCRRVQEVIMNRRLVRTRWGQRLGLVSARKINSPRPGQARNSQIIKEGDLICILHGCSVPVVLRRVRKSEEQLEQERKEDWKEHREKHAAIIQRWWRRMMSFRPKSTTTLVTSVLPDASSLLTVDNAEASGSRQRRRKRGTTPNRDTSPTSKRQKNGVNAPPPSGDLSPSSGHNGASSLYTHNLQTSPPTIQGEFDGVRRATTTHARLLSPSGRAGRSADTSNGSSSRRKTAGDVSPSPAPKRRKNAVAAKAPRPSNSRDASQTPHPTREGGDDPRSLEERPLTEDERYRKLAGEARCEIQSEYYYEFWGECYIHGMMDGEALEVQSDSIAQVESVRNGSTGVGSEHRNSLERQGGGWAGGPMDEGMGEHEATGKGRITTQVFELR